MARSKEEGIERCTYIPRAEVERGTFYRSNTLLNMLSVHYPNSLCARGYSTPRSQIRKPRHKSITCPSPRVRKGSSDRLFPDLGPWAVVKIDGIWKERDLRYLPVAGKGSKT